MSKDADGNTPGLFSSLILLGLILVVGIVAYLTRVSK